ncbi:hypothetical protein BC629DRAFT_1602328 [Irpex lacteus]|nr:hypothetical protein BC629DRAFT_1602328 [Irpex lacteus]
MSSPPSSPLHAYQDSSPESSPALEPIDSSPPSSPALQPVSLSPPVSPGPAHPYAASTKAVKQPRLYEKRDAFYSDDEDVFGDVREHASSAWSLSPRKKRVSMHSHTRALSNASTSSSITDATLGRHIAPRQLLFGPPRSSQRSLSTDSRDELAAIDLSDDEDTTFKRPLRPQSHLEREKHIWDAAITTAVDTADGLIDLQQEGLISTGLSFIPPTIADLASLVVLPSKENNPTTAVQAQTPAGPRIRPFVRSVTFPARKNAPFLSAPEVHSLAKATSMTLRESLTPIPPGVASLTSEVNLLLGNNAITKLPVELFSLSNLTVLSMRNNSLTHIPPQIALLTNLRELNVARNKLKYLPAEMLEMTLDVLVVDHNPWLTPPTSADGEPASSSSRTALPLPNNTAQPPQREATATTANRTAIVSGTTVNYKIPSLTEFCLRVLLAPFDQRSSNPPPSTSLHDTPLHTHSHQGTRPRTRLEALYELPLPHIDHYPDKVVKALRACVPAAVNKPQAHVQASPAKRARRSSTRSQLSDVFGPTVRDEDDDEGDDAEVEEETHSGIGTCMSPVHALRHARPVFVDPAEQRFEWVRTVAGRAVHEDVPVLWRGCMRGCLDFLDASDLHSHNRSQAEEEEGGEGKKGAAFGGDSIGLGISEEDVEEGEGEGVEEVDLGGGMGLEEDGFD